MKRIQIIISFMIVAALALAGAAWLMDAWGFFASPAGQPAEQVGAQSKTEAFGRLQESRSTSTIPYPDPFGTPQEIVQGIYAADRDDPFDADKDVRALVVPHHMVAAEDIALGIKALQGQGITDIILISPDHYSQCPSLFCTTDRPFETAFGKVVASSTEIATLMSSNLVTRDEHLFIKEHGIYSILPFIKHYLPDVRVTPLVISLTHHWEDQQPSMADLWDGLLGEATVLIVSSDFSHYLSLAQAESNDQKTIETIESADLSGIAALQNPAQSDCPACLWGLAQIAKKRGFYHPIVLMHTNSATLLKQPDIPETTSHFSIVWTR